MVGYSFVLPDLQRTYLLAFLPTCLLALEPKPSIEFGRGKTISVTSVVQGALLIIDPGGILLS